MWEKKNGFGQEHQTAELIGSVGESLNGWLLQARWREIGDRPFHWLPSPSIFGMSGIDLRSDDRG